MLSMVPGLRLAAPRDGVTLREELAEACAVEDAPTVIRFAKGAVPQTIPAIETSGEGADRVDVVHRSGDPDVLIVAVGSMVGTAIETAQRLQAQGIGATVVDPRWVVPVPKVLADLATGHRLVVVVEDNLVEGGVGSAVRALLAERGIVTPVRGFGIPRAFLTHGARPGVLERIGLTAQAISREVTEAVAPLRTESAKGPDNGPTNGSGNGSAEFDRMAAEIATDGRQGDHIAGDQHRAG
jgi:1-deoxy-D-xylulose-5-phosphate synthase